MLYVYQQKQTGCQSTVCVSSAACASVNQHWLQIQYNLTTLKQSFIGFLHYHPNQALLANSSEQRPLCLSYYSHVVNLTSSLNLGAKYLPVFTKHTQKTNLQMCIFVIALKLFHFIIQ